MEGGGNGGGVGFVGECGCVCVKSKLCVVCCCVWLECVFGLCVWFRKAFSTATAPNWRLCYVHACGFTLACRSLQQRK